MSAIPPTDSAWREPVTARVLQRARQFHPGPAIVHFGSAPEIPHSSTRPALICTIRVPSAPPIPGYTRIATNRLKTYQPLHQLLTQIHPVIGRPFRPNGIFHHVGERPCGTRYPGLVEEYWLDDTRLAERPLERPFRRTLALAVATVLGIGCLPAIGATLASALTALLAVELSLNFAWSSVLTLFTILTALSTLLCFLVESIATRHFLNDDAREFVLDEVAGMALTILFLPTGSWVKILIAFAAFRFFDVLKPGIRWIESRPWPGKVVCDDLLAGLYAGITAGILTRILPFG